MPTHGAWKLRSRIFLSYSIIIAAILTALATGLTIYLRSNLEFQESRNLEFLCQKSATQLDDSIRSLQEVAVQIGVTPACVEAFSALSHSPRQPGNRFETDFFEAGKQIQRSLAGIKYMHFSSGRISLYDDYGNYVGYGRFGENRDLRNQVLAGGLIPNLNQQLLALDGKPLILEPHADFWSDRTDGPLVSVIWNVKDLDTTTSYGIVEVQQAFSEVTRLVNPAAHTDTTALLLSSSGQILWSNTPSAGLREAGLDQVFTSTTSDNSGSLLKWFGPIQREAFYLLSWSRASQVPWTIVYLRTEANVLTPLRYTTTILVLAALAIIGLSLGVVMLLSIRLAQPLQRLRLQLDKVDLNNLSVRLEESADADIAFINQAFADMFARLKSSTDQLVLARAHEAKAHLLALQSQMDPHFIFNILSVLNAEARSIKASRLVTICTTLADTLRYVSDYDNASTSLQAEFNHVQSYLELMRFRFEAGLEFQLSPLANAEAVFVPKLILQPVVENCFRHGFAGRRPPWRIDISATASDQDWRVEINDNGCGWEESERQAILDQVEQFMADPATTIDRLKIGGLGLVNTLVRLRLHYGGSAIFELGTNGNGGTRICLGGPRC